MFKLLNGEVVNTNSTVQKASITKNKRKISNCFAPGGTGSLRLAIIDMVKEEARTIFAPLKLLEIRRIVSPLGGAKFSEKRTSEVKSNPHNF